MKTSMFAALLLASTFIAGGAAAQPAPFNATGVTMGHWHIISNNVDANKKLFLAMGAQDVRRLWQSPDDVPGQSVLPREVSGVSGQPD